MIYLLDANTYIEAKNRYYQMDICPGFWQWLDLQFEQGHVASVEMVWDELKPYGDELSDWVKERKAHFYNEADDETQTIFADIAQHLANGGYNAANLDDFLGGADPWLIAKAKSIGATVVTHESLVSADSRKVKIPNVCRDFAVEFIGTFELLRLLKARFVLETL